MWHFETLLQFYFYFLVFTSPLFLYSFSKIRWYWFFFSSLSSCLTFFFLVPVFLWSTSQHFFWRKIWGKLQYETLVYMFHLLQRGCQSFSISKLLLPARAPPRRKSERTRLLVYMSTMGKASFKPSLWNFSGDFPWLILPGCLLNSPTDAKIQGIKLKDIKALIESHISKEENQSEDIFWVCE